MKTRTFPIFQNQRLRRRKTIWEGWARGSSATGSPPTERPGRARETLCRVIHTNRFRGRTAPCPRVSPPSTLPALRAPRRAGSRFFQSIPPLRSCRLSASAARRYSPWEFRAPMRKNRLSRENRGRPNLRQHKPLTAKLPRARRARKGRRTKKRKRRVSWFAFCPRPPPFTSGKKPMAQKFRHFYFSPRFFRNRSARKGKKNAPAQTGAFLIKTNLYKTKPERIIFFSDAWQTRARARQIPPQSPRAPERRSARACLFRSRRSSRKTIRPAKGCPRRRRLSNPQTYR